MRFELREYTIEDGRLDDFVAEWRELVRPLRVARGFSVLGPWVAREQSLFVWIMGYDGDLEAADAAYYASSERTTLEPNPARLIVESRHVSLEAP